MPETTDLTASPEEVKIIEASEAPGQAAWKIAAKRGCTFGEGLLIVQEWLHDNDA